MLQRIRSFLFVSLVLAVPAAAQVQLAWSTRIDGTGQSLSDSVFDMALGPADSTYVAGLAYTGTNDVLEFGALVAKVDANGQLLWKRVVDQPGLSAEAFTHVAVDAAGNVVVIGSSAQSVSGPATQDFALRFDSLGNILWRYDAPGASIRLSALAIGPGGEIYVGGSRPGAGGQSDAYVQKFLANGVESWTTVLAGSAGGPDATLALEVDALGQVYAAGDVGLGAVGSVFVAKLAVASGATLFFNEGLGAQIERSFRAFALAPDGSTAVTVRAESGGLSEFEYVTYDPAGQVRSDGHAAGQAEVGYSEGADIVFGDAQRIHAVGTIAIAGPGFATSLVLTGLVNSFETFGSGIAGDAAIYESGVSIDRDPDGGAFVLSAGSDGPFQPMRQVLVSRINPDGGLAWTRTVSSPLTVVAPRKILVASDGTLRVAADWSTTPIGRDIQILKLEPDVVAFCEGDGSAAACPCGNAGNPGAGCLDSFGQSGRLESIGVASLLSDSLLLRARHPSTTVLYFQGTSAIGGGHGAVFGDGLLCTGGAIVRIARRTTTVGFSMYPGPGEPPISVAGGVTSPGERFYQAWYRNAASFCTPSSFNLTNGLRVRWTP